jgi:hypothetical protein
MANPDARGIFQDTYQRTYRDNPGGDMCNEEISHEAISLGRLKIMGTGDFPHQAVVLLL